MDKVEREIITELNENLRELLSLFRTLVDNQHRLLQPRPLPNGESPDSPAGEKAYICRRLGRTRSGFDSLIQSYRQEFKADPPFVVRKPGSQWIPNVEAFEEWRKTSEGKKSIVKRKRGRPARM